MVPFFSFCMSSSVGGTSFSITLVDASSSLGSSRTSCLPFLILNIRFLQLRLIFPVEWYLKLESIIWAYFISLFVTSSLFGCVFVTGDLLLFFLTWYASLDCLSSVVARIADNLLAPNLISLLRRISLLLCLIPVLLWVDSLTIILVRHLLNFYCQSQH